VQVIAVPVKSLEAAKSRLDPVLSPAERAVLTLALFEDVAEACIAQKGWEVWVVSHSEAVLEVAVRRGARPVAERGRSLLQAVRQVEEAVGGRWSRLAIVLADLPLLTPGAMTAALAVGAGSPVAAAPAGSDGGTNLLVRRPPTAIPARFGPSSFARHRAEAARRKIGFAEVRTPELGFDLDRPADLTRLLAEGRTGRARSVCLEMGLAERLAVRA
jgi:2-phospho-L-lactate/phosphoenolpyruvate guanylyltransferase